MSRVIWMVIDSVGVGALKDSEKSTMPAAAASKRASADPPVRQAPGAPIGRPRPFAPRHSPPPGQRRGWLHCLPSPRRPWSLSAG